MLSCCSLLCTDIGFIFHPLWILSCLYDV